MKELCALGFSDEARSHEVLRQSGGEVRGALALLQRPLLEPFHKRLWSDKPESPVDIHHPDKQVRPGLAAGTATSVQAIYSPASLSFSLFIYSCIHLTFSLVAHPAPSYKCQTTEIGGNKTAVHTSPRLGGCTSLTTCQGSS